MDDNNEPSVRAPHSLGSFVVKSYLDSTKVTPDSKNREFKPPINY